MIIFDSSVWIAIMNKNDSHHKKAIDILEEIDFSQIVVPKDIYTEVLTVLRLRVSLEACKKFVTLLEHLDVAITFPSKEDFLSSQKIFFGQTKKLSFVDSLLVYFSTQGTEIITFDKDLEKSLLRLLSKNEVTPKIKKDRKSTKKLSDSDFINI